MCCKLCKHLMSTTDTVQNALPSSNPSAETYIKNTMASPVQDKNTPVKAEEEYSAGNEPSSSIARACFSHDAGGKATGFQQFPGAGVISVGGLVNPNPSPYPYPYPYPSPNSIPNPNPNPNTNTASIALSGHAAVGVRSAKLGKRRSKATSKPPIKVFSADAANFMAMVQNLTGIPSNACQLVGSPQTSLLKSLPTRLSHPSMQGLHTLDTSASFIGDSAATNLFNDSFLSKMPRFSRFRPSLGQQLQFDSFHNFNIAPNMAGGQLSASSFPPLVPNSDLKSLLPQLLRKTTTSLGPSCAAASLPSLWDPLEEDKLKQESSTGGGDGDTPHEGMPGDLDQCTSREVPSWESQG